MLGAGRQAAEVRVRVYLWLWAGLSTRGYQNVDLRRTTGTWAELVDIVADDAVSHQAKREQAARRVTRAINYLSSEGLVRREGRDTLRLLEPSGSTDAGFEPWSAEHRRSRDKDRSDLARFYSTRLDYRRSAVWEDNPLQLPAELWMNGTISALPAAAIVALLILWDYEAAPCELIIVPKSRPYEYPVSPSTWRNGLAQLESRGLIARELGPVLFRASNSAPDAGDRHRIRWRINHEQLGC
jgi:hypothetical protein